MNETFATLIRSALKIVGGGLISKGIISESAMTDATGAIIVLVGIVWGIFAARKASRNNPEVPFDKKPGGPFGGLGSLKLLLGLLLPAFLCGGCSLLPVKLLDPDVISALSQDTNSLDVEIITVHGTVRIKRNMDRTNTATNGPSVLISPETTLKVRSQ